jgi:hypothetical protein
MKDSYPIGLCQNAFDWFDRICLINLPHRTDRMIECRSEFSKVGLKRYEIVNPIPNPRPELSLILTNLSIIKQAQADGVERLLVLEDDVHFIGDARCNLLKTINEVHYTDWKLLYLGALIRQRQQKAGENTMRLHFGLGTHAVAYHKSAFTEIIILLQSYGKRFIIPIDRVYMEFMQKQQSVYMCCPMVAVQRDSFSDVENKYTVYQMEKNFEKYNPIDKILIID